MPTPWPGGGRQTFEWHESGAHLVGRSTVDNPDAPDSVSIIGCDGQHGTYFQLYADERGIRRIYRMGIGDGVWRLERDAPPFGQRYTGTFSEDGDTITGRWEIAEDGDTYRTDFNLTSGRGHVPDIERRRQPL